MPTLNMRIYADVKPQISPLNPVEIADKIFNLLGPAIPDFSGWGLLRPGLLNLRLISEACRRWGAERKMREISERPVMKGEWIIFDYIFSKTMKANPLITCLKSMGIVKYGEIKLTDTYVITIGLNLNKGVMIFLYKGGKAVEEELDNIAYIISHILKCPNISRVQLDANVLCQIAHHLSTSVNWRWIGWTTKEGQTIPGEIIRQKWQEKYEKMLKDGEWRELKFESRYGRIRLAITKRKTAVNVLIKERFYAPGPARDITPILDELLNSIKQYKTIKISYDPQDKAGILKAYTERRGIVASQYIIKKELALEPFDVSYEFKGYDIEAGNYKIEVKAFRDSIQKNIELTKNEYDTMRKESNYMLFIVENAWDDYPIISIIKNPNELLFNKLIRDELHLTTTYEEYFECEETVWRSRATLQTHSEIN